MLKATRIIKFFLPLFFVSVLSSAGNAQNLIVNPGAETLPTTGWTILKKGTDCSSGSNWRTIGNQNGYPPAREGTYIFTPGCGGLQSGETYEIYQDINVSTSSASIDAGKYTLSFSGYMQSYPQTPADEATFIVEYRDAGNNIVLQSYNTGPTTNTSNVWVHYTDTRLAPAGTRFIRIRLIAASRNGSDIDAYFDNLSLTALSTLPVNYVSFTAKVAAGSAKLFWQTSSEAGNKGFHIERSADGLTWQQIGFVISAGHLSSITNYEYADINPLPGNNYYRLVQEDIDGKIKHSETRKINFTNNPNTISHAIYPNPVQGMLSIRTSLVNPQIQIIDSYGKITGTYYNQQAIKTDHLPAGLYFLTIESKGRKEILKFVKR